MVVALISAAGALPAFAANHGRVQAGLSVASPLLGHDIPYAIYLPQTPRPATKPLPVLYLLHGRDDTEMAWLEKGSIATILDRLIDAGSLPPVAVVMPMAANSWYVDDARGKSGFGPYATAFLQDFLPAIESRHHLATCRDNRAIAGLSMGGFGAMLYALMHPETFTAAISLSGSLFSDLPADIETRRPFFDRVMPGIYGEPFNAQRFLSWNVFQRLDQAPAEAKSLGVWLAAGDGDFSGILNGTVRMHQELKRRQIESHLRIYGGEHTWELWSMAIEPALIWLAPRLRGSCEKP